MNMELFLLQILENRNSSNFFLSFHNEKKLITKKKISEIIYTSYKNEFPIKGKITKTATDKIARNIVDSMQQELVQHGRFNIVGFGSFKVKHKNESNKVLQLPGSRKGETITIAARNVVRFKAGKSLKESVQDFDYTKIKSDEESD